MNPAQLHFTETRPSILPPSDPLFGFKSIGFWGHNILTLGLSGSVTAVLNDFRIRRLELIHEHLEKKVNDLNQAWDELETQLTSVLFQINSDTPDVSDDHIKHLLEIIETKKRSFVQQKIKPLDLKGVTFFQKVIGIIRGIGYLIANVLTLGVYGAGHYIALCNRIQLLEAKNKDIQIQFERRKQQKLSHFEKIGESIDQFLTTKENNRIVEGRLNQIKETDPAKAYFEIQKMSAEVGAAKKKQEELEVEVMALKLQQSALENQIGVKSSEIQKFKLHDTQLTGENKQLKQEVAQFKQQNTLALEQVNTLRNRLTETELKAKKVQQLESEVNKLKVTQKSQPDIIKLSSQIGPIPSKYQRRPEDGELSGAMDVEKEKAHMLAHEVSSARLYNQRYGDKRSAAQIAIASFRYACDQLFLIKNAGGMIQLNKAGMTSTTKGIYAVYRYMALDLIKNGKITTNQCHGFKLDVNEHVSFLPSQSENVLYYKPDVQLGLKPEVQYRYKQRDDFTPSEEALNTRDGVDAVAARWILEQLSEEEALILFTYLMADVVDNHHPDYLKMRAFIADRFNPRAKLVQTAFELIQDVGVALEKKFSSTVLVDSLQEEFDEWDIDPYIKPEDSQVGLEDVADQLRVEWKIDRDVIGDKRQFSSYPSQYEFITLIENNQKKYQHVFAHMKQLRSQGQSFLEMEYPVDRQFTKVEWAEVNSQYNVCHQMIGAHAPDFLGGERCLFSNLLAIFVSDQHHLTTQNVQKLKKSMATYLDKLILARNAWKWDPDNNKKPDVLSQEKLKQKELKELADFFEKEIKTIHQCSISQYQNWLRGEWFNGPPIKTSELTELEIQLAAFAIGVRIAVLPMKETAPIKIDELGRIVPEGSVYGPNTEELMVMGYCNKSYYGLFPKLKIPDSDQNIPDDVMNAIYDLTDYWQAIRMK
ncbi:MAG: hypothetical protein ACH350_02970 [Parachlamydiaceae bacterium]